MNMLLCPGQLQLPRHHSHQQSRAARALKYTMVKSEHVVRSKSNKLVILTHFGGKVVVFKSLFLLILLLGKLIKVRNSSLLHLIYVTCSKRKVCMQNVDSNLHREFYVSFSADFGSLVLTSLISATNFEGELWRNGIKF